MHCFNRLGRDPGAGQEEPASDFERIWAHAELRPGEPRYAYVYGVGLHSAGRVDQALAVLAAAHEAIPADREILVALVTMNQEAANLSEALGHARRLPATRPTTSRSSRS